MILALLLEGSAFVTSVNTSVLVVLNADQCSLLPWSLVLISSSVHIGLQVVTMRQSLLRPSESAPVTLDTVESSENF